MPEVLLMNAIYPKSNRESSWFGFLAQIFLNPSLHIDPPFRDCPNEEPANEGKKDTWNLVRF